MFLRGTRGPVRRWCDSRTCGNAARVRQYRTNQKTVSAQT
ncbi:MAG: CGNR zinc finger domain-containing protein [Pseudomonadota bacterium]